MRGVLESGDEIDNIFFYADGVHNANVYTHPVSDEFNAYEAWCCLAVSAKTSLMVCITAAERRGIVDDELAEQYDLLGANLKAPFQQVGLGDFFEKLHKVDKLVQF